MRVILDGEKLPANLRTTKDLLLLIKSIARVQRWKTLYDPAKEVVYISTIQSDTPLNELMGEVPSVEELESIRLQGKIICLDPGHGGADPGAIGPSGTCEKDNVLAIAIRLKEQLEKNGATVVMTRYLENERAAEDAQSNLEQRMHAINDSEADFFISIHNDAFSSNMASGTTTFHYGKEPSVRLAGCVQKSIIDQLGTKDRGIRFASFYLLRYAEIPGILVEAAFITNPEEEVLLASADGREKIAAAIYQGIAQYLKV